MAKKNEFSVGQIVRLKSGGPEMTVQKENTNLEGDVVAYSCQWFAGKKLEKGSFPPDSLEVVKSEN